MALTIRDVQHEADTRLRASEPLAALYLYQLLCQRDLFDFDARLRIGDALAALGDVQRAGRVYTAVAIYCTRAGYPLRAITAVKLLTALDPALGRKLLDPLAAAYGKGSPQLGRGVRVAPTDTDAALAPEALAPPANLDAQAIAESACALASDLSKVAVFPEKLPTIPLLSEIPPDTFAHAIAVVDLLRAGPGEPIIREGEPGTAFFVIARGTVRVYKTSTLGHTTDLARLGEGSIFGEMALLTASPRTASVVADPDADLIVWNRDALGTLSREIVAVGKALEAFTRERLLNNLLATNPLFHPFDRKQKLDLLGRFTAHEVAPMTPIIREGQEARGLFVLLQGEVDVTKIDGADKVLLATLKAGDVFGEISLLRGGLTTATVTAARQCTVMFLAREYFQRLIQAVPAVKAYFEGLSEERMMDTNMVLSSTPEEPKDDAADDAEELTEDDLVLI